MSLGLVHFLQIYLLAQLSGLISQVPGGLGVCESVILLLAPAQASTPELLGALVVYRGIYYLGPLVVATAALGAEELLRHRAFFERVHSWSGEVLAGVIVPLLSLAVFVAGAILMFSGALPSIPHRLAYLKQTVPLPFLELSHFLGSLAGMGLLLLARGLQRRLDVAFHLTLALLGFGIVASLLKGFDYEEASILAIFLLTLLPYRRLFFRRTALLAERFTAGWLMAIIVVVTSSLWLGFFAFRHVEYSNELWWHFSATAEGPRFLRASVGALALALAFGLTHLLRPARYKPPKAVTVETSDVVTTLVTRSPSSYANLALLGDKQFLVDREGQAFVMYGVSRETWVTMGDPVGDLQYWPELLWQFRQMADWYGGRAAFYEVGHRHLHFYLDMGLSLLKLGEEGRVPLTDFSLDGHRRKSLRHSHRKMIKEGCTFEIIPIPSITDHMVTLKTISDAWLNGKNTREKGFSQGSFDPIYIKQFPIGIVRHQQRIVAFANIWISAVREEMSIDLMRHLPESPGGVMDFLFIELMLWGANEGYRWFNLGMAPLSGMENRELAPLSHRLGGLVVRLGGHFYNFQGLRAYKEKSIQSGSPDTWLLQEGYPSPGHWPISVHWSPEG